MSRTGRPKTGGRKKGTPNKVTAEIREMARNLLEQPKYRAKLAADLEARKIAPPIEQMLYAYAYGKPKEQVELTGKDGAPLHPPVVSQRHPNVVRDDLLELLALEAGGPEALAKQILTLGSKKTPS